MTQNNQLQVFCAKSKVVFCNYSELDWKSENLKLFKIKLSDFENQVSLLLPFLNPDEIARAQRYHSKKDTNRFIICRVVLKILLAKQIGLVVEKVIIKNDKNRKPYLPSNPSIFFNLSHSIDYGFIALGDRAMGVDVERVNSDYDYTQILPQVFSKIEINVLQNSANPAKTFYTFWTRKEAIVKATGKGIDDDFKEIPSLDGVHFKKSTLLETNQKLFVKSFDFDNEYVGAIALTNHDISLTSLTCYRISTIL
jgi:4'-phosphopantetheinyl transferase